MPEALSPIQVVAFDQTVATTAPVPIKSVSSPRPLGSGSEPNGSPAETLDKTLEDADKVNGEANGNGAKQGATARPFTAHEKGKTMFSDEQHSLRSPLSIPSIVVDDAVPRPSSRWSERKWGVLKSRKSSESVRTRTTPAPPVEPSFQGISLNLPSGGFEDLTLESMRFSKRGSLLNEKKSVSPAAPSPIDSRSGTLTGSPRKRASSSLRVRQSAYTSRAISADEDMLSRRVRLMYEKGDENVTDAEVSRAIAEENGILWEEGTPTETSMNHLSDVNTSTTDFRSISSVGGTSTIKREFQELAGGIEDWQNVEAGDVDRYGFIVPRTNKDGQDSVEIHPIQRVSTSLLLASETPRRKSTLRRSPSTQKSSRSLAGKSPTRDRKPSDTSNRPSSSQSGYDSVLKRSPSKFRYATNRLPYNKDRRARDEAGDMLTLPFEVPEAREDKPSTSTTKKKEWVREDKWMKMAKSTKKAQDGSGMTFEFDTTSSKLIERTWKGIPDSWRATAWYAFLETSARRKKNSPSAEQLIQAFHEYQEVSSPDDVQIDIDVPRTISSHIMFRRRYRGGQRLLFRVLHAMSLYFPDTGYVQGMAAIAATLLAYYDEENAFIMLARLWMLRGLEQLYKEGFAGLMEALGDFEKDWLGNGEVAGKLVRKLLTAFLTFFFLLFFGIVTDSCSFSERTWNPTNIVRHTMVFDFVQLFNSLPGTASCLGRLYASRRHRRSNFVKVHYEWRRCRACKLLRPGL
jgi:hypothetical protein